MENNIINLDQEYFKRKNKEAYEKLMNKEFKAVKEILAEPIEKIDEVIKAERKYCPQNMFEAAIFLNFLDPKATQDEFSRINYYDFYLMMGASCYNLNEMDNARKFYKKAIEVNPASAIAKLQLLEIDKIEKTFDNFIDETKDFFTLAYRRKDMARAYRNIGYYLFEIEDYEMAIVAYYLSNAYELTELSMQEVKHISEVANIDISEKDWLSEEMMEAFYSKYKLPLLPNPNLAKLAVAMGEDAYEKKAFKSASFSYGIAYELTLEEQYLNKVEELNKIVHK